MNNSPSSLDSDSPGCGAPVDVAIVIVGLNAREYIRGCLNSLAAAEWHDLRHEIVYVDNGSTDGTLEMLDEFPQVVVIRNPTNVGYCPAANQGTGRTSARYLFFLNDDTIVLGDAVVQLVEFMDASPNVGVIGSRLFYPDMTEQWSGRRFPTVANAVLGRCTAFGRWFPNAAPVVKYLCKSELDAGIPFPVDWVSAAAILVRRETFLAVGGFAEDYYYWHESVFCDRVRKLNQEVFLHPRSRIIHYEGKGSGPRPYRVRRFHIVNFHDGAYRCYCEHFGLSLWNPARWFAFAALKVRAAMLLAMAWLGDFWRSERQPG